MQATVEVCVPLQWLKLREMYDYLPHRTHRGTSSRMWHLLVHSLRTTCVTVLYT